MSTAIGIRKECFAFANDTDGGCKVLNRLYCKREKCKFYKPMCQYMQENKDD